MSEVEPQTVRTVEHFESFYRREYSPVATLAMVLSGRAAVGEDLAQESFLRAHARWDEVGSHQNPEGWVRRVTINLARSRFRRIRAEAKALTRLGIAESVVPALDSEAEQFWATVRDLPARQAQVIALHYLEDRPVAEIAEVLGVSEGSVKTHLHRARQGLAARLSEGSGR